MAYVPSVSTNNGVGCISTDGNTSCVLSEQGFQLSTNLLTTPITATFGTNGLSTTNPSGLLTQSTLNLNGNSITNGNTITATTFSGTATNATNVNITSDGSTTTACSIPYVKTTTTGNKPLFIDDSAPTFTYTPNTGTLSCTIARANSFVNGVSSDFTITNQTLTNKIVFNTSNTPAVQCCQMDTTGLVMSSTKKISSASTAGAELIFNVPNASGNLVFEGANIQTSVAGDNAGQFLRIKLNGTFYKLRLLID